MLQILLKASRGFKILFKLKSIKNFDYFILKKKGKLVVIDLQQKILVIYCNITERSMNNGSSIKQQLVLTYLDNF
jgi:hypothetical protein